MVVVVMMMMMMIVVAAAAVQVAVVAAVVVGREEGMTILMRPKPSSFFAMWSVIISTSLSAKLDNEGEDDDDLVREQAGWI